jgi:hypothetical protein
MKVPILERARRYLVTLPPAISGQRGHDTTFKAACRMVHGFALGEAEALGLLREWNQNCQPPWNEADLIHKVRSAMATTHREARGYLLGSTERRGPAGPAHSALGRPAGSVAALQAGSARPESPAAATDRFLRGFRCGEADVMAASPLQPPEDGRGDGALLVSSLYQPGELVNYVTDFIEEADQTGVVKARPRGKGITLERDELVARLNITRPDASRAGGWLRMNPVDGRGIADANVAAWRFALLESDELPTELQLALFVRLPLPIAALISSGSRSIHAWVRMDARDEAEYRGGVARMLDLLDRFGVDGKNKNPSRLSRLPGVRRVIGAVGDGRQRLIYLNPNPNGRNIL